MDNSFGSKSQQTIPPLQTMTTLGTLHCTDGSATGAPVKIEISGTIDKGFFLADNEWTCYRRNYFSCICSYSLTPYFPSTTMHFLQTSSQQSYQVYGFAMCISAVVADNDGQAIELVQHTPKRDKGPIARPEKVRLNPKPPQANHHPLGAYSQVDTGLVGSSRYEQGYTNVQGSYPTEHTFERIQFKQATANNGKRRAAQQYYHLMVELYADIGTQGSEQFLKIAYRKSAKMIVRGRSPGHYQSERRGSTSSGPGGSAGSIGYGSSQLLGSEFGPQGATMLSSGYGGGYDPRTSHYGSGTRHHHDLPMEPIMSAEEAKALNDTKEYQYYPTPIYDASHDPRQPVEMFTHSRGEHDTATSHAGSGLDLGSKVKSEFDGSLPRLFYPGPHAFTKALGRFEGKSSSGGYYPTMMPPSSGLNIT
ncbi:uncharacterized protein E0L32_011132 [Thyridium curvatum]|uniref:NDT80 domain-containing protein n=1 Tax=Thyridium curvatum TaxID=1093900 RepID=A0A507AJI1_9PEZI|nr:uncharacterized protein E0L32_011132 [Thyridium curvatum]TPX06987.1 hypothetical protein E0L32_011132 [Thyridium curvatum]